MATFTDILRLTLQAQDENDDTWGGVLNNQLEKLEAAIAGVATLTVVGSDVTLSTANGSEDEASKAVLLLQGEPTADRNVIVPAKSKLYLVRNTTTGSFDVTVKTSAGTGVKVPRNEARILYCDGTDVVHAFKAEDTKLVAGTTPGDIVGRDVGASAGDEVPDRDAADARYVRQSELSGGSFATGDVKLSIATSQTGWVLMDDGTIGPAGSGGTTRANDDTETLFKLLWDNVDDEWAPVTGGRGADADTDWDAGKTIALPKVLGRALAVAGAGDDLTSRALGEALGEEEHQLTNPETPVHSHKMLANDTTNKGFSGAWAAAEAHMPHSMQDGGGDDYEVRVTSTDPTLAPTSESGNDEPHNNMQPSTFLNCLIKL